MTPYFEDDSVRLYLEDCLDVLPALPDASVHAVICDPPYGLASHRPTVIAETLATRLAGDRTHVPDGRGFLGKAWDAFVPPPAVWDERLWSSRRRPWLRVNHPGGEEP